MLPAPRELINARKMTNSHDTTARNDFTFFKTSTLTALANISFDVRRGALLQPVRCSVPMTYGVVATGHAIRGHSLYSSRTVFLQEFRWNLGSNPGIPAPRRL